MVMDIVPEKARKTMGHGTIRAVGPGRMLENGHRMKMTSRVGDIAVFPLGGKEGWKVSMKGEEYMVFHEADLLAIIDTEDSK